MKWLRACLPILAPFMLALAEASAPAPVEADHTETAHEMPANVEPEGKVSHEQDIPARLSLGNVIRGHFQQSKDHAGLPMPLLSEGEFIFWRGHGVHWATESPVQQTIVYRSDKTLQSSDDSTEVRELRGRNERAFRRILLDIFSFDEAQLRRQFKLKWTVDEQRWQLRLRPKTWTLKRALQEVNLSGGEFVDSLRIVDAQGLALEMHFSTQQRSDLSLDIQNCETTFFYSAEQCQQHQAN